MGALVANGGGVTLWGGATKEAQYGATEEGMSETLQYVFY
jgi:hypothetical protein